MRAIIASAAILQSCITDHDRYRAVCLTGVKTIMKMNNTKRFLAILLVLSMALGLMACGKKEQPKEVVKSTPEGKYVLFVITA